MIGDRPRYLAYMLRLWMGSEAGCTWRASLESPYTGERHAFRDLESLFAFLEEETSRALRREGDAPGECGPPGGLHNQALPSGLDSPTKDE